MKLNGARGKFGEHERSVIVARGVAEGNSSFLSALQTFQVHHNSMEHSLKHEPIVFITLPMEMGIKTRAWTN